MPEVGGRQNSDYICMGLAGVSLIFDFLLLGGTMRESAPMIQISGIWGSFDCVVDAIVGFLSANYTVPSFSHEETKTVHKSGLRRTLGQALEHRCMGDIVEGLLQVEAQEAPESASVHRTFGLHHLPF
ncbi:uncharacterized protein LOC142586138 [Dermacentor variabilis]|uniref:uncharacterized protein LOC142586138 n=1 Tax=Dermacentor variabilis TaxID=34621 RepID=UPI003F5B9C41